MNPRTHYRSESAEQLYTCAECGLPQPNRAMLLSSRGPVCNICAAESNAAQRADSHYREAAVDAVFLSAFANLGGIGLLLAHTQIFEWPTRTAGWAVGFVVVILLAIRFAVAGFRRARAVHRRVRSSIPALMAMGLAGSALAFCLAATVLFVLG